jgi:6-phosphogluconolactonase
MPRSHLVPVLVLMLAGCKESPPRQPADAGGGRDGGSAGTGGGGIGGGGSGGSPMDAATTPDGSRPDAPAPDVARDIVASEPMPGAEAIVRSDARLPGDSPFVYIGAASEIRVYQLDLATGMLVGRDSIAVMGPAGTTMAGYMTWDSKKNVMYAAHRLGNATVPDGGLPRFAAVSAYSIDKMTGGLTKLGATVPIPNMDGATHIEVHSDKYLYVANYAGHSVTVLGIAADGSVGSIIETKLMQASGVPYRNAHQAVVDGNFLLVPCLGLDVVAQFLIDPATGRLSENTPHTVMVPSMPVSPADGGAAGSSPGPRHLAFSADKKFAYVVNELQGTITVFAYDSAKGSLGAVVENVVSSAAGGPRETAASHPVVYKNVLYVSNRNTKSIGVYKIDPLAGKLTLVEHELAGGMITYPRDFTVDPTGKFLIVVNERNVPDNVANVLEISPADGSLTPRQTLGIPQASQFAGVLQLP